MEVLEKVLFAQRDVILKRICSLVENSSDRMIMRTMLEQEFSHLLYILVNAKVYIPIELRNIKWQPSEK